MSSTDTSSTRAITRCVSTTTFDSFLSAGQLSTMNKEDQKERAAEEKNKTEALTLQKMVGYARQTSGNVTEGAAGAGKGVLGLVRRLTSK
ncbi:hypothetical protein TW65_08182 [Stemphylium lycopersici]|uniref:Uncharacterized protein n=1 Tax=Stemphylium lycopersici TaxID=183478 RepID=A0A364NGG1_STELY|nr:hypothetical protein TW65_08182 [Stemphylium lycopersici]RAR16425.1 hypothetical protein DDE83_000298 [Stemphylium lycopersici]